MNLFPPATRVSVSLAFALLFSACASTSVPEGMKAGQFVRFACEGGTYQARASDDGKSVRIRALHGSAELDMKSPGVFAGEGYQLMTNEPGGATLTHNGKVQGRNCKVA